MNSLKKFLIYLAYTITHLLWLTKLPVFSDEAIYIRWAQVAFNEPQKYAFLPMLDGKPPLHSWLIVPFLKFFAEPLFAGRLLSVLAGAISMFVVGKIVRLLGGEKKEELLSMILVGIVPFWFLHQRMALADALLTLFFSMGILFGLRLFRKKLMKRDMLFFGLSFAAALWVKTTTFFFIPVYALLPLMQIAVQKHKLQKSALMKVYFSKATIMLILGGIFAGAVFLLLKVSPLFPYLFIRSGDYTFTVTQLLQGEWKVVLFASLPEKLWWIFWYMTPFAFLLSLFERRKNLVLLLMAAAYTIPLITVGRVLYPRYFLPVAPLFTLTAVLGYQQARNSVSWKKIGNLLLGGLLIFSLIFSGISVLKPESTSYVKADKQQYLFSWSAGYGIPEVRDFLKEKIVQKKIVVATEGYFGTLPDGLLMYFDHIPNSGNIRIEGIGVPVNNIPVWLIDTSKTTETYIVANEDRILITDRTHLKLVSSFPRPNKKPGLLLLRVIP